MLPLTITQGQQARRATTRLLLPLLLGAAVVASLCLAGLLKAALTSRRRQEQRPRRTAGATHARARPSRTPPRALARELGRVGRSLYLAIVIALLALTAALAAIVVPRALGYGALVVTGGSMGKAAPNGSVVIGRWVAAAEVKVGQVILAKEPLEDGTAQPKLHRIVSLERDGDQVLVRTKGDANETEDPKLYVLPDRVLTPVYKLPYLGFFLGVVVTPIGWAAVVGIPAVILCVSTLRSIWSDEDEAAAPEPPAIADLAEDRRRRAA